MGLLNIVLFAALFATGLAKVVKIEDCGSDAICKVSEVRIMPCAGAKCALKKGTNASISFDFTPKFAASKLKTLVYCASCTVELPFEGFGSDDGCQYTTCPTEAGKSQTLDYNLHLGTKLPTGSFTLKWKVWNEDDENQECCFKTEVALRRKK